MKKYRILISCESTTEDALNDIENRVSYLVGCGWVPVGSPDFLYPEEGKCFISQAVYMPTKKIDTAFGGFDE